MAVSRISANDGSSAGASIGSLQTNWNNAPTANNILFVVTYSNSGPGSVTSVSDNTATAYSKKISRGFGNAGDTNAEIAIWTKIALGTETSATMNATIGGLQMQIGELKGVANPVVIDTSNTNSSGATSETSWGMPSITTAVAGDYILEVVGCSGVSGIINFNTATVFDGANLTKMALGQYIPGTTVSGFADTANNLASTRVGGIVIAFKPIIPESGVNINQAVNRVGTY